MDAIPRQGIQRQIAVQEDSGTVHQTPGMQPDATVRKKLRCSRWAEASNQAPERSLVSPPGNIHRDVAQAPLGKEEGNEECRDIVERADVYGASSLYR